MIGLLLTMTLAALISSCGSSRPVPGGSTDFQFKKYYNGGFTELGIGGLDTPVLSGLAFDSADASFPNVYYSSGLDKYIMVFNMVVWNEFKEPTPTLNGIYYATSEDGINWSTPIRIITGWSIALGWNEFIWHPSIVWDSDSDDQTKGYLIYSKGNQNTRHYMVCRRIELDSFFLGAEQVVLGPSNNLGLEWFPDTVTTVIPGTSQYPFRMLLTAGQDSYLVEGEDLFHLTHKVGPVLTKGAPGSIDNGYAGISGAVVYGSTIYAIYHTEDHENMPGLEGGVPGYYATVSLAKSTDNGYSFTKLGQVITSQKPKSWTAYPNQADRGAGEPCLVVSKDGTEIFLYYVDHSRVNGRGVQIFMAKAAKPDNPTL